MSCLKNEQLRPLMLLAHGFIPVTAMGHHANHGWKLEAFWLWYDNRGRHKHKIDDVTYNTMKFNKRLLFQQEAWTAFDQWCSHYRRWGIEQKQKMELDHYRRDEHEKG